MLRRLIAFTSALTAGALACADIISTRAVAQDTVKVGAIVPLTGGQSAVGERLQAAIRLYMEKNGATVAGEKIELIIKDDAGVADNSKRLAQELIVNEKVAVVGSALTPSAMAIGPLSTQGKVANVVMVSGTSAAINPNNPYMVRTGFTLAGTPASLPNGRPRTAAEGGDCSVRLGAGSRSHRRVHGRLHQGRRPSRGHHQSAPRKSGFLAVSTACARSQPRYAVRVRTGGAGRTSPAVRRGGLDKAGIRLIGPGDIVDDNDLPGMGDAMLGVVTAGIYSAAHPSQMNKEYVVAFEKANNVRPNFISVGGYDGMHLIYEAIRKTGGRTDADSLVSAMKGMKWESPRGPISIDADTREIVQNVYMGKVEKVNGEFYNIQFATFEAVKDPLKMKKWIAC